MIMWIRYISDTALPPQITVFVNGDSIIFHDDALGPDTLGSDGVYAAYLHEDIPSFLSEVSALQSNLAEQGSFTIFNGHFAQLDTATHTFDVVNFNNNHIVPFDGSLINGASCTNDLLPQNSLFITDLSVVEDPARTYNVAYNTGNPVGVWTFGSLIKNIVNDTTTGKCRTFLKNWIRSYYVGRNVNSDSILPRTDAYIFLIKPWLDKANESNTIYNSTAHYESNWETDWGNTNEDSLLINAPFKLLAIVNRMDLRGNSGYTGAITLAGETRFIYTLIAPIDYPIGSDISSGTNKYNAAKGTVPMQVKNGPSDNNKFMDWKGMNVILEYGNPQTHICDAQAFAQAWADLSSDTLNNYNYNDSLEVITRTVTDAGAAPTKINGSALDRLRSNERIFFPATADAVDSSSVATWSQSDWQLSQFELNSSTHQLAPVPVTNTPQVSAITQTNIVSDAANAISTDTSISIALINWVYANKFRVAAGGHQIPFTYTVAGRIMRLAGTADMTNEQGHFWDLYWDAPTGPYYTTISPGTTDTFARTLRRQLSLNTCQGCHGGETKTLFTQIRPVGYGVSENYWSNTVPPESETGRVDLRFVQNAGTSKWNSVMASVYSLIAPSTTFPSPSYDDSTTSITVPDVSAFLTGRTYHGGSDYSDDYNGDDGTDQFIGGGSYFVYDPADANDSTGDHTRPNPDRAFGFNDLLMRKNSLCQFVNIDCHNASITVSVVNTALHIPIPE